MTAYQGAAVSGILSGSTLAAALGIWATEAYHAGAIRALLIQNIGTPELAVSSNGMNTTITLDQIVSLVKSSCWLCSAAALHSAMFCISAFHTQGCHAEGARAGSTARPRPSLLAGFAPLQLATWAFICDPCMTGPCRCSRRPSCASLCPM